MQKLTNRNAEIRVVDLVLRLDLEITVVLVPKVANFCVRLCVCVKSFSEKTALSRMAMKSSSSELGRWVNRVSA